MVCREVVVGPESTVLAETITPVSMRPASPSRANRKRRTELGGRPDRRTCRHARGANRSKRKVASEAIEPVAFWSDMNAGWVFSENLRPFLESVAALSGNELEPDVWTVVEQDLFRPSSVPAHDTTAVDCPLGGGDPVRIKLSHELGTSVVSYELVSHGELEPKVDGVVIVMQAYDVRRRENR